MSGRTIAIGDIHGCADALAALIDAINPGPADTVVALGDYIDRGPDSRGVLQQLMALGKSCRLVPLLGDHEEMLLDAVRDRAHLEKWLKCGAAATLRSYGWKSGGPRRPLANWISEAHRQFLSNCVLYYETATHLFVHAGFEPDLPMEMQAGLALRWRTTDARTTQAHISGKVAVVGHTRQVSGDVLDLGFLICIDTNCVRGGWLTALDVGAGALWQADRSGRIRTGRLNRASPPIT